MSVAPFSELAARYGDDLAILWIDSHPDIGTPASEYPGYHAMAVAALIGHGDPDVLSLLPAIVSPERVALVGLHSWTEVDYPNVAEWGIRSFSPGDLRQSSEPVLGWLAAIGCTRVAIHFDVDTIDSDERVRRGAWRAQQRPGTPDRHRRESCRGGGRIHHCGILPASGDAHAADPGRLPSHR